MCFKCITFNTAELVNMLKFNVKLKFPSLMSTSQDSGSVSLLKVRKCRALPVLWKTEATDQLTLAFCSSCQQIKLSNMAYISLVIASKLRILLFSILYFVTTSIYTKNTHSVISHILQSLLHETESVSCWILIALFYFHSVVSISFNLSSYALS